MSNEFRNPADICQPNKRISRVFGRGRRPDVGIYMCLDSIMYLPDDNNGIFWPMIISDYCLNFCDIDRIKYDFMAFMQILCLSRMRNRD